MDVCSIYIYVYIIYWKKMVYKRNSKFWKQFLPPCQAVAQAHQPSAAPTSLPAAAQLGPASALTHQPAPSPPLTPPSRGPPQPRRPTRAAPHAPAPTSVPTSATRFHPSATRTTSPSSSRNRRHPPSHHALMAWLGGRPFLPYRGNPLTPPPWPLTSLSPPK